MRNKHGYSPQQTEQNICLMGWKVIKHQLGTEWTLPTVSRLEEAPAMAAPGQKGLEFRVAHGSQILFPFHR